jgi:hypothetical protein
VNVERIRWPLHAQRRLQERDISIVEVEDAIRNPDQVVADPRHAGRWVAQKRQDLAGRPALLRVVYANAGGGDVVVVSAYRTTQVARYWRSDQ